MKPKTFLIVLATVALAGWIGGNWALGPAGYTADYLEQFSHQHDHYLDVIKSDAYKLHEERPHLYPADWADAPPHFKENLEFVEQYEANPEFQAQRARIGWYELYFDFFNATLVVVLIVFFAKAPLLRALDAQIAAIRERLDASEHARREAADRLAQAQLQLAGLAAEEAQVREETDAKVAFELEQLAQANEQSLAQVRAELADRRNREVLAAQSRVRRALVNRTMKALEADLRGRETELHAAQVAAFAEQLERGA